MARALLLIITLSLPLIWVFVPVQYGQEIWLKVYCPLAVPYGAYVWVKNDDKFILWIFMTPLMFYCAINVLLAIYKFFESGLAATHVNFMMVQVLYFEIFMRIAIIHTISSLIIFFFRKRGWI